MPSLGEKEFPDDSGESGRGGGGGEPSGTKLIFFLDLYSWIGPTPKKSSLKIRSGPTDSNATPTPFISDHYSRYDTLTSDDILYSSFYN